MQKNKPGKIFLIPSFLGENNTSLIPEQVISAVGGLCYFIVEDARSARRYLRAIGYKKDFDKNVNIKELNKHASTQPLKELFEPILEGIDCGIISEAGNPCIADPGNVIVSYAHKKNIDVVPLVGPSSILLALIASGFNGQSFSFHGYLPIQNPDRQKAIQKMEKQATQFGSSQLFMETPFRNQKLFEEILRTCRKETNLCVACDITLPSQLIKTQSVAEWQNTSINLHKRFCIFLIG